MKEFTRSSLPQSNSFVAILRGVSPSLCLQMAAAIYAQGVELIELPINLGKKAAFTCVEKLAHSFPEKKIGIGTVLEVADVVSGYQAGATFIVAPNFNFNVVSKTKELGMFSIPGILTPSEAISALAAGADALKIFPISAFPPSAMQGMLGVLPPHTIIMPTGNPTPQVAIDYLKAGASKIGLGSTIYKVGDSVQSVAQNLRDFLAIINN